MKTTKDNFFAFRHRLKTAVARLLLVASLLSFYNGSTLSQSLGIQTTQNTACNGIPCGWPGPKILINEIMVSPANNDGSISGPGPSGGRGEWVELYNPDACNAADISCFILGNNTFEGSGAFRIPPNTIVPPLGFAIIRGVDAPTIPAAWLVANGGNVVNITAAPEVNVPEICVVGNPGNRFWFPNSGGWIAIYDAAGVPQDAIRWGTANISSLAVSPCIPGPATCPTPASLPNYNNIPLNRKAFASVTNANNHLGQSIRRVIDGGVWSEYGTPTFAQCNGVCYTTAQTMCTGTATITSAPGTAPYTYQWNDPYNQTTPYAINLCEGSYEVTVTSSDNIVTTQTVTISPFTPTVTFNSTQVCLNAGVQTISGFSPVATAGQSGSFSGPGVTNNQFNPVSAGVGSHTINYTFTNQNGCTNNASATFTVLPVPLVSLSPLPTVCITNPPLPITFSPAGATLTGPGVSGNMFDPGLAGAGTHQITLTYLDPNSCTNPATTVLTTNVTVNAQVNPTFPTLPLYCVGDNVPNLPTTSNQGILGTWSPAINNQETTTYTFTPAANQCALSTTFTIPISSGITPTFLPVGPFCVNDVIPALPFVSTNSITGSWSPAINNQVTTTYTFTPVPGQCAASITKTIVVNPILTPSFTQVSPICSGASIAPLPTTSQNNVIGTWSPALNNSTTTSYTFTPNAGQCAVNGSMQIIVVGGSISLSCPANQTAACFSEISTPYSNLTDFLNAGGVLSSSNSALVSNNFSLISETANGSSCNEQMLRVYNFNNICGQTASCTQTIAINDNIPPQGNAPGALTIQCISQLPPVDVNSVTNVSDNCSTPTVTHLNDISNGTCPQIITRIYRIQDACGNFTDVNQTITVFDTIPPSGVAPSSLSFGCITEVPAPNSNVISNVTDNCSIPVVTHIGDVFSGTCPQIITRTYRIQDACGNFTDLEQLISVWDSIPPTGNAPPNLTVNCVNEVPTPNINTLTNVFDNCTPPTVTFLSDEDSGSCPQIITRIYRIQDACGNFIDVSQLITVLDSIPPTGTAPPNITVNCPSEVPSPNINLVTNVNDNCQFTTVSHFSDVSNGNLCNNEVITRTYLIQDACGNQTFVSHTITINLVTPNASLNFSNPTTCSGNEGSIFISNLNNNTAYTINYNNETISNNSNGSGNITINNLFQGDYSNFQISYSNCGFCQQQINQVLTLTDPPSPIVFAGEDVSFCDGNSYFIEASNPENAAISWSNNIQDGSIITPLVGTNIYLVTAVLNNCVGTDELVITVHPIPLVNAGDDQTVCDNTPIFVEATGALIYYWSDGIENGVPFYQIDNQRVYHVIGIDQFGCFDEDSIVVSLVDNPYPSFTPDYASSCERPFVVNFNNTSSLETLNCTWDFGIAGEIVGACNMVEAIYEYTGCYAVTLTVEYTNGCVNSSIVDSVVCLYPVPTAQFVTAPSVPVVDSEVQFINTSSNASQFIWILGNGEPQINSEELFYSYNSSGLYDVTLIAINEFGCVDSTQQTLEVTNPIILYVPNAFTPDGDQYNNEFKPILAGGYDPYNYELTIFNRWGEILFESLNAQIGWPGTYGGKLVPEGSYVWQIRVKNENGITEMHRGHVSVLK